MRELVYTAIDPTTKKSWGDGPWLNEPDKVQWEDKETKLPCLAVRNGYMGNWCGYVGVPPGHPAYGKGYDDLDVGVHGGLTFSSHCDDGGDEGSSICHLPDPGEPDNVWWLGFDCAHAGDLVPYLAKHSHIVEGDVYRDLEYVKKEVASLAKQLEKT